MMKEKSNKFLTIVFGVIAIILAGYIYYNKLCSENKTTPKEVPKCLTQEEIKLKDIVGLYSNTIKDSNTEEDITHFIYLMDNGMFSYVLKGEDEIVTYIGNYILEDNTITLNCWFDTDSNLEKYNVVDNKEQLIINNDKTITLENKHKLKEVTGDEKKNELSNKVYDVANILKQVTVGIRQ